MSKSLNFPGVGNLEKGQDPIQSTNQSLREATMDLAMCRNLFPRYLSHMRIGQITDILEEIALIGQTSVLWRAASLDFQIHALRMSYSSHSLVPPSLRRISLLISNRT